MHNPHGDSSGNIARTIDVDTFTGTSFTNRSGSRGSSGGRGGIVTTPGCIKFTGSDEFIVTYATGEVESGGGLGFHEVGRLECYVDKFIAVRVVCVCKKWWKEGML